ncbi:MAG: NAD(P)H-dependent oxidoreductase [Lachnospiraceae bacterium]|nr:NAD(P)H-dependent oxidoreductase [Lachnospiraceae bacterium]
MSEQILYVNACVRKDSRTAKLAKKLLARLDEPYEEIILEDIRFPVVSEAFLNKRDSLISAGNSQDPMFDLARQFKTAETIVIAAPYWDMSFPAMLKQYLEQVNVVGITFKYSKDGVPVGLCRANRLIFVTTAGGCYVPDIYGFGYVRELAQNYYGIQDVRKIEAVGLDIDGADIEKLMRDAEAAVEAVKIYRD